MVRLRVTALRGASSCSQERIVAAQDPARCSSKSPHPFAALLSSWCLFKDPQPGAEALTSRDLLLRLHAHLTHLPKSTPDAVCTVILGYAALLELRADQHAQVCARWTACALLLPTSQDISPSSPTLPSRHVVRALSKLSLLHTFHFPPLNTSLEALLSRFVELGHCAQQLLLDEDRSPLQRYVDHTRTSPRTIDTSASSRGLFDVACLLHNDPLASIPWESQLPRPLENVCGWLSVLLEVARAERDHDRPPNLFWSVRQKREVRAAPPEVLHLSLQPTPNTPSAHAISLTLLAQFPDTSPPAQLALLLPPTLKFLEHSRPTRLFAWYAPSLLELDLVRTPHNGDPNACIEVFWIPNDPTEAIYHTALTGPL